MKDQATLELILNEQRRVGTAIEGINGAIHQIHYENARLPEKVRVIVKEEMVSCPAYQYFKRRGDGDKIDETTHEVEIHKEIIDNLKEKLEEQTREIEQLRRSKASLPPRSQRPWWSKILVPVATSFAAILTTCAFTVRCSTDPSVQHDPSSGIKIAQQNR